MSRSFRDTANHFRNRKTIANQKVVHRRIERRKLNREIETV